MPILQAFQSKCPLFELGVSFIVINYICLSFMQIHAVFYLWINQMIISKNPQFTGISARQQLEFTTHLLLTD